MRPPALRSPSAPLLIAALAAFLVLFWQAATVRYNFGGNWTALFCTGGAQRLPPALSGGTYRFAHPHGYDGQFYRLIAHDPFFTKGYAGYIDDARLRYRRILVPLAAWVLGVGRPEWIDSAIVALVLASVFAGAYWTSRWAVLRGRHPAWGLLFLAVPAVPASIDRLLLDATLTAMMAGFLVAAERRDARCLYLLSALACLTRETGILLVGGVVLDALLHRRWRAAAGFASAVLPALAWWTYVAAHTAPSAAASHNMGYPVVGIILRLFTPRSIATGLVGAVIQATDALALLGLLGSLALAVYWAWRPKPGPDGIAVLLFAALGAALTSATYLDEPFGFGRPISPLLIFVLFQALAQGRWAAWAAMAPPLVITMGVGVHFVSPVWRILRGIAPW